MKSVKILLTTLFLISFFSCQHESEEVIADVNNIQSIAATTPLTALIERVTQSPTGIDNVIDKCSCYSVLLPVTVTVDGQTIVVNTASSYAAVQTVINASNTDDDIIHFTFPITIKYKNYQTQVISSQSQLDSEYNDCHDDDGFDEISCVHFVFPFSANVYNSGSQVPSTVTFHNNSELHNFLVNLNSSTLVSINYPISVVNSSGQTIVINSNSQLEDFIEGSIGACNSGSGSGSSLDFVATLTTGTWHISYYFDDQDLTNQFSGYTFTFLSNGTVTGVSGSTTINGTWSTYIDSSNIRKLVLNFSGNTLQNLNEDWKTIEFTATSIRLKDVSGGNGGTNYLYFTKN